VIQLVPLATFDPILGFQPTFSKILVEYSMTTLIPDNYCKHAKVHPINVPYLNLGLVNISLYVT